MNTRSFVSGLTVGAGVMFVMDPAHGNRRRALARDQAAHFQKVTINYVKKAQRDLSNRAHGLVADAKATVTERFVPDVILAQRVRAHLGHVCSHPSAIEVRADDGVISLYGQILATEVNDVLSEIAAIHGVKDIQGNLEAHEYPDHVSSLQGKGKLRVRRHRLDMSQPGMILLALFVGLAFGIFRQVPKAKILTSPRFWKVRDPQRDDGMAA